MKQRDLLIILVPAFLLSILWIIFSIYHNLTTSTIKDPLNSQIIPIEGKFDTATINKLKEKQRVNPLFNIAVEEIVLESSESSEIEDLIPIEEIVPTETIEEQTAPAEETQTEEPVQ